MYKVILKKNEEKRLFDGHPWVYANEVSKIEGSGKNGDEASVYTFDNKFIGKGFINHLSKILVRIMSTTNRPLDAEFFAEKIKNANDLRKVYDYSSYRAVFSEADNLPSLIVDKYNDILSIQILSLGLDQRKEIILKCLIDIFNPRGIYERSDVSVREKEGLKPFKGVLYGDFDTKFEIEENGLKMIVDVENGQKTGYFLDQKENRMALRKYVKDKTVLDCFANIGGFAINAAKGKAKQVTALDISQSAVDYINKNAALNGLNVKTRCCDVFDQLREYKQTNTKFDVIVLDPPAFCKSADKTKEAYKGYRDINIMAMKLLNDGGILATCSCSHYMSSGLFEEMLTESAKHSKKVVRCLEKRTQSPDHPTLLGADETMYLKFYILQVNDR